jgi:hypothetical protein
LEVNQVVALEVNQVVALEVNQVVALEVNQVVALEVNQVVDLEMATQQRQQQDFRAGQQHLAYLQQDSAHQQVALVPQLQLQHPEGSEAPHQQFQQGLVENWLHPQQYNHYNKEIL